jgi:diadenosine tetraphosphate (Ap4A) HIT family hydrolase
MGFVMTYAALVEFLETKMSMSHIYQPLLIRALVDAGGAATLRQLAQDFLSQDESQLLFYEDRIKKMPLKVLARHGVLKSEGQLVTLDLPHLTLEQRAHVRMICEQKLQSYVQKRGLGIWDYRLLDTDPVPDSLRYSVLKASGGRCALCGVTKDDRPLDVDHIKPRSRGGKTELSNLQALCTKCNRSKRNQDDTDFRAMLQPDREPACPFCSPELLDRAVDENGSVFAVRDNFPVTPGHLLVIPKRHVTDYFAISQLERTNADELIRLLRNRIVEEDAKVVAFNVGVNCGEISGQTIMHAHIHLIPRRKGDVADPRGGIRGVIPEKRIYPTNPGL